MDAAPQIDTVFWYDFNAMRGDGTLRPSLRHAVQPERVVAGSWVLVDDYDWDGGCACIGQVRHVGELTAEVVPAYWIRGADGFLRHDPLGSRAFIHIIEAQVTL
jgi:hypothetical protein